MSSLRSLFPGYYDPSYYALTKQQLAGYRRWCTIALDSNVLLGLYAYSQKTRDDFLRILSAMKDRIWLPHQAAYEYEKNRISRIKEQLNASTTTRKLLEPIGKEFGDKATKNQPKVGLEVQHPFMSVERIVSDLTDLVGRITADLKAEEAKYGGLLKEDPVRDRLQTVTDGRIGERFPQEELEQIYDSGAKRYSREQPPGYKDGRLCGGKTGVEQFGDLVLWRQLVVRGKETGRSIWLVTDDMKEDWWLMVGGQRSGPRPELVEEMSALASVRFLISTSEEFYEWAGGHLKKRASRTAMAEAARSSVQSSWVLPVTYLASFSHSMAMLPQLESLMQIFKERQEAISEMAGNLLAQTRLDELLEAVRRSMSIDMSWIGEELMRAMRSPEETPKTHGEPDQPLQDGANRQGIDPGEEPGPPQ